MKRRLSAWVTRCSRPVDVRPLALVRILLALCVFLDLLSLVSGLAWDLFSTEGGTRKMLHHAANAYVLDAIADDDGMLVFWTALASMGCVALGIGGRAVQILAVLAFAQLGALYPGGDRGIDRILRTALLILSCSQAHRCFSIQEWLRGRRPRTTTPGWVVDALLVLLTTVYLSAGLAKVGGGHWFSLTAVPELFRILSDAVTGTLDPGWPVWRALWPLFWLAGALTVLWECSAPLVFTRHARRWAACGVVLHLGIAATMKLGMFAWGMLALYPVVFRADVSRALDRRRNTATQAEPPPGAP